MYHTRKDELGNVLFLGEVQGILFGLPIPTEKIQAFPQWGSTDATYDCLICGPVEIGQLTASTLARPEKSLPLPSVCFFLKVGKREKSVEKLKRVDQENGRRKAMMQRSLFRKSYGPHAQVYLRSNKVDANKKYNPIVWPSCLGLP